VICRKRRYTSETDRHALKHIRDLNRRGYYNLHVYQCEVCGHGVFHVGHTRGAPKMRDFLFGKKETV
jgi:hypothetical protein